MNFRKLPPFQSLIAFEAAARLLSFKAAANELFLTPPAVTYRIKELESLLGLDLFNRTPKGLELTSAGEKYYLEIEKCLKAVLQATQDAKAHQSSKQLRVQMLPFMATEVVIPKLSDFYQQQPDIDIQIDTKYAMADFQREEVDVAIRFGLGDWHGLVNKKLMPVSVALVCSQEYATQNKINSVQDLNQATLVSLSNDKYNWEMFAKNSAFEKISPKRELHFNDYTLCLRAAEQNMGITFGVFPLVQQWIQSKRLIQPFSLSQDMPQAYYFCYQENNLKLEQIEAFYSWIMKILP